MTQAISSKQQLQDFLSSIEHDIKTIDKVNAEFIERFKEDPASALEWSSDIFSKAAMRKVLLIMQSVANKQLSSGMDAKEILKGIQNTATKEALRKARFPTHSTSAPANEIELSLGAAWAELAEKLSYFVGEEVR